MTAKASNYKATFVLDTRGREESVDELIEGLKADLASAGAEVSKVENMGKKDFVSVPDARYTSGHYVQYNFAGGPSVPAAVTEKLRLNKTISHKIIQKTS